MKAFIGIIETHVLETRISKLEGAYESLKVVRPLTVTVMGIGVAAIIGGFAFLGTQMSSLSGQIASLRGDMQTGFSAIRTEMREDRIAAETKSREDRIADKAHLDAQLAAIKADTTAQVNAINANTAAQIGAIANAIVAVKQQAPQVILVPAPSAEIHKAP